MARFLLSGSFPLACSWPGIPGRAVPRREAVGFQRPRPGHPGLSRQKHYRLHFIILCKFGGDVNPGVFAFHGYFSDFFPIILGYNL